MKFFSTSHTGISSSLEALTTKWDDRSPKDRTPQKYAGLLEDFKKAKEKYVGQRGGRSAETAQRGFHHRLGVFEGSADRLGQGKGRGLSLAIKNWKKVTQKLAAVV